MGNIKYFERRDAPLTKFITYASYGSAIPYAMRAYMKTHGIDLNDRTDANLLAFIESSLLGTSDDAEQHPDKLFCLSEVPYKRGPVSSTVYLGYDTDMSRVVRVVVNNIPESAHVIIQEYDGRESLCPLPEYEPVPGVPGLYREVDDRKED